MQRRTFLALGTSVLASGAAATSSSAVATPSQNSGDSDTGLAPEGSLEIVARFDDPGPSGIAVTPDGGIFVGFPRHAIDHNKATLGELRDGRLVPFPSAVMSLPSDRPAAEWLVSVHGMTTDTRGRLWVIDDGKRAGHSIPDGGAKVMGFEPDTGRIVAQVVLEPPALRPDSHMNDLRVDLSHGAAGTAYVADSSFGTNPALVVVDLATGAQRRVLADHPSTQPDRGFMAVLEGRPLVWKAKDAPFPTGGVDGVTLSPDSKTFYYSPLSSRRLYSIATDILADPQATEAQLAAAVTDEGEKGFADGLCSDLEGRIYTTNGEHDAVFCRDTDGSFGVVVRDPRIIWPDGIFATPTHVYVVCGQWNRLAGMNDGVNRRRPPYLLIRSPIIPVAPLTSP